MADDIDRAAVATDEHLQRSLAAARQPVPAGAPGECRTCFEQWPRLVGGRCAPCRDGRIRQ